IEVFGVRSLKQLVLHLTKVKPLSAQPQTRIQIQESTSNYDTLTDMQDIMGQEQAKRALEIAAAGGHNILMQGLPGSGKTLLARAFPTILPPLEPTEALEVSTIYSINGLLGKQPLIKHR